MITVEDQAGAAAKEAQPSMLIGWLAGFGVLMVWSGWVVVSRLGVVQSLTIYDMAVMRYIVAMVAVSPFILRYWPRHLAWWQILVLASGPGVPYVLIAFAGMQFAPASHAGILLNGTLPILSALFGWFLFGQKSTWFKLAGMALILLGCALIGSDRSSDGVRPDAWIGQILFLVSATIVTGYMIGTRVWNVTPMQALVVIPTTNAILFLPIYLAFLPKAVHTAPWTETALQALYQGLGPSILGVLFFTAAVRALGPTRSAAIMAGVPGLAALLAIPVLGEWPSALAWAGLAFATVGILITAGLGAKPASE